MIDQTEGLQSLFILNIVLFGLGAVILLVEPYSLGFTNGIGVTALASLWFTVAAVSFIALWNPVVFMPVVLLQLVYKILFLVLYVVPKLWYGKFGAIPVELTVLFVFWIGGVLYMEGDLKLFDLLPKKAEDK